MAQHPSITWVSSPGRGIGSQMFGLITTFCIARDLEMHFYVQYASSDLTRADFKLQNALIRTTPNPKQEPFQINDNALAILESKDKDCVENLWRGKHITIQSVQNLYQHFAYPRPNCDYKNNLLYALINCSKYFFVFPPNNPDKTDYKNSVGIHIRPNQPQDVITNILKTCKAREASKNIVIVCKNNPRINILDIAKKIFGAGVMVSNKGDLADLLVLKKCKSLYIPWNSNFARMGAIMNPYRDFYVYNPIVGPTLFNYRKCEVDELLSYSKK